MDRFNSAKRMAGLNQVMLRRASQDQRADLGEKGMTCEVHGEYTSVGVRLGFGSKPEIWSQCPKCLEEAARIEAEEEKARAEKIAAQQMAYAIEKSGIPERFKTKRFDTFVASTPAHESAFMICKSYANSFDSVYESGMSLVLAGKPGTGKSHLAASIMHAIMPDRIPLYMTCMDMIRSIRDTWRRGSEKIETQVLKELTDVCLLVIDEVGVQYGTDGEQTIIFDVLDRRYREQMPTIIITNQDAKGFREFVGDRCNDRLKETGKWVPFGWDSYRPSARIDAIGEK